MRAYSICSSRLNRGLEPSYTRVVFGETGEAFTRRALVRYTAAGAAAVIVARTLGDDALAAALKRRRRAPVLNWLQITNGATPFAGDGRLLTTLSPRVQGGSRKAYVRFHLARAARVEIELARTSQRGIHPINRRVERLGRGSHELPVRIDRSLPAGTYLVRLTVTDARGRTRLYGADRSEKGPRGRAPVLRVLGVEAAFRERSYAPGNVAGLRIETDARKLTLQLFRSGPEAEATHGRDEMRGVPVAEPRALDWHSKGSRRHSVRVGIGPWPTGLYFARLDADDGRVGFAPFIVRSGRLGTSRTAVVLPTHTWQAYNFYDADGDGFGDTWYARGSPPVVLDRPYTSRGVPPHFRTYDLPFLRWLTRTAKDVEFLAEDDLERFRTGDILRSHYDLVVFSGHSEYVTDRVYDIVERYRDLGGNLAFMSANTFFWKVRRRGNRIERVALWRDVGRPEAALIGVQYLANDDGSIQDAYVVSGAEEAPWLFAGTGLRNGSAFGHYGIEIDARTAASPPQTTTLATIPELFGPGRTAEMTYYETTAGARVFAAGVMAFAGSADRWEVSQILENLWVRLAPTQPRRPP